MRNEYDQALKELRDAKNRGGLASIEGRRKALEDQISAVESQLHQTEAEHAAATARLKSKRASIENTPKPLLKQLVGGMPNDGLAQMRDRLFQLQVQQEELRSKFSDSHPNVVAVNKQVVELTDILNREDPEREQIIKTLCSEEEARHAALTAQEASLHAQLKELQKNLTALNEDEILVTQTTLKVKQLETKYMTYAANSEDARIDKELRDDKISNLSVIQPASLSPIAIFPQKSSTLLIAVLREWWEECCSLLSRNNCGAFAWHKSTKRRIPNWSSNTSASLKRRIIRNRLLLAAPPRPCIPKVCNS